MERWETLADISVPMHWPAKYPLVLPLPLRPARLGREAIYSYDK